MKHGNTQPPVAGVRAGTFILRGDSIVLMGEMDGDVDEAQAQKVRRPWLLALSVLVGLPNTLTLRRKSITGSTFLGFRRNSSAEHRTTMVRSYTGGTIFRLILAVDQTPDVWPGRNSTPIN